MVDGLLDVATADAAYAREFTPAQSLVVQALARADPPTLDQAGQNDSDDSGETDATAISYHEARAMRERYEALLSKAEYLKTIGSLVDAESVRRAAFTTGRQSMQSIMALKSRLDPLLSTEPDAHKRSLIWDRELRQICTEMAAGRENAINSVMTEH